MENERVQQLFHWMEAENISASFITSKANVFYLSGFYTNPHERLVAILVFPNEAPVMIVPNMEIEQVKASGCTFDIIGYSDTDDPWDLVKKAAINHSIERIAIEKEHIAFCRVERLQDIFETPQFVSVEKKLQELRSIKDKSEIIFLKKAANLADFGVEVGVSAIREGVSELAVLATIEYELKKKGVLEMSFSTMVLTGTKTAAPHGKPGLDLIKKGDLILFDLGVVYNGYCSDITRVVALGDITHKQQDIYETVLEAQREALNSSKPGGIIGDIDTIARTIISEKGYGDYFTHRIGHGLGIDVHEFPSMNATNTNTLQTGMTYTIEPGIYVQGVGGVRIEDDVLITETGFETLTKYPKKLQIL